MIGGVVDTRARRLPVSAESVGQAETSYGGVSGCLYKREAEVVGQEDARP